MVSVKLAILIISLSLIISSANTLSRRRFKNYGFYFAKRGPGKPYEQPYEPWIKYRLLRGSIFQKDQLEPQVNVFIALAMPPCYTLNTITSRRWFTNYGYTKKRDGKFDHIDILFDLYDKSRLRSFKVKMHL